MGEGSHKPPRTFRRLILGAAAAASVLILAACTAAPPPPIESTESPKATTVVPVKNTVVVAVDDIGLGFNPHLLSGQSAANRAVGSLVLPSAFRPVPSAVHPGATDWVPDESVLVSAAITSQEPFTITYQLRNEAQWSDSAPIAAEDFRYLWQQMISQPGVVDPAGYRLIQDVNSSGGGKTVTVTMSAPYPAWRELFTSLLPSHLVKDSPGGFTRGLSENIPVSGARFHIKSIDLGRDEILLERNDRFWGQPATPDQILMRRGGSAPQLADSMRTGDAQVAQVHGGSATLAQLAAIPGVRTGSTLQPRVLQLALNARVPSLSDLKVRRGVLGLLDADLLTTVGAGNESSVTPARAQVLAPSDPGYASTAPAKLTRDQALGLLSEVGYAQQATAAPVVTGDGETHTLGHLVRAGEQLKFVTGVPENDEVAAAVANTAADQLRAAGVDASVVRMPAAELYGDALVEGRVDAVVGWVRAASDPATALASRFSCPPPPVPARPGTGGDPSTVAGSPMVGNPLAPSNLSGVCDPALQPAIDGALRGVGSVSQVLADVQPRLWDLAVTLPILQDATVVAAGPGVAGVSLAGAVPVGIVSDAATWWRTR